MYLIENAIIYVAQARYGFRIVEFFSEKQKKAPAT